MAASDSDARRHAIVLAVWMLIARNGIEAVTFRRVAEQAGVSVGRIQHHFGTREALVRAACAAMIDFAHAEYQELPDDPAARLRHIMLHAIPDSPRKRFGASVWHAYLAKSVDDSEIARLLADTKRGVEDECARLIEQAGPPVPDPGARGARTVATGARTVARRLLALADGLIVRVLVGDLSGAEARELLESELAPHLTVPR